MKKSKIIIAILSVFAIIIFVIGLVYFKSPRNNEIIKIDDNYRVYYEIFPYSFYDTNKDGIGDLKGIVEKLDYINDANDKTGDDLGCNGIWLMPITVSTTYHKYDVVDYYNIDPEYGTIEDFKLLVTECEKRDIKLIIDLVFNHTSSKNKWFLDAVSYLESLEVGATPDVNECPYIEYYNFVEGKPESEGFYKAGNSNYYYEAMFWEHMPDLNLDNEKVRAEIEQIAKFWMDLGAGGFRLDAAKEFFSGNVNKNTEVLDWFTAYVKNIDEDAYVVAEVWDNDTVIEQMYASNVDSMFNFPLSRHDGLISKTVNRHIPTNAAKSFGKNIVKYQEKYSANNPDYIDAPFLANHDMARLTGYYISDSDKMKMAAGILMTLNGSPFLYYGEEIGMNSIGQKDESKRTPFRWSNVSDEGITSGPAGMELAEPKFATLKEQMEDEQSLFRYYTRAIRMRNENPELARGTITLNEELSGDTICVLTKKYNESEIIVIYNISPEAGEVDLSSMVGEKEIYSQVNVDISQESILEDGKIKMPKYSIAILK